MHKYIYFLILLILPLTSFSQERWDQQGATYVNYTYGFAWILDSSLTWKKTIGSERHTIFRAKNEELQIMVFVNAQRYFLDEIGTDIWKQYDVYRNMYTNLIKKVAESKGYNYKLKLFEKTRIFGKHAIKIVSINEPKYVNEYSEPPVTQHIIRTYDHGLAYSINILIPTELDNDMIKDDVHVEYLFNGFKFTAN